MKSRHRQPAATATRSNAVLFLIPLLAVSIAANAYLAVRLMRPPPPPAPPEPSGLLRAYAALGSFTAENNRIPDLRWTEEQYAAFAHGLRASYEGRGYPLDEDAQALRDAIEKRVQAMIEIEQPNPVQQYFRTLRETEGVQQTPSGLHYRVTLEGSGAPPGPDDTVVISFAARLPDGTALPALTRVRQRLAVADMIPGMAEGVRRLTPGGKALIYVPAALSFPPDAWPADVPPGSPVGFFLELHEIVPRESVATP